MPSIFTEYEVTTGKDGRFAFERVVAGRADLGRRILLMVKDGAIDITSSCMTPTMLTAGVTTQLDLGGTGCPVIGQFQPVPGFKGKVDWRFALIHTSLDMQFPPKPDDPPIPPEIAADPAQKAAWMLKWQQTPAGQAWLGWRLTVEGLEEQRDAHPHFIASIERDGAFRIDDVPAGSYSLSLHFDRNPAGRLRNHRFLVPAMEGNRSDRPLDLGILTLE